MFQVNAVAECYHTSGEELYLAKPFNSFDCLASFHKGSETSKAKYIQYNNGKKELEPNKLGNQEQGKQNTHAQTQQP